MICDVYIGYAYSKNFDYDIKGPSSGYTPDNALPNPEKDVLHVMLLSDIYQAIWKHPKKKQVDWGCSVIKMYKEELIDFLLQYDETRLAARAKENLQNNVEYVIAAVEGIDF